MWSPGWILEQTNSFKWKLRKSEWSVDFMYEYRFINCNKCKMIMGETGYGSYGDSVLFLPFFYKSKAVVIEIGITRRQKISKNNTSKSTRRDWQHQMLARLPSNRNSFIVGETQNDTPNLEDSLAVFTKTKQTLTIRSGSCAPWYIYPKELKTYIHTKTCK